jgi:hypothetical protein
MIRGQRLDVKKVDVTFFLALKQHSADVPGFDHSLGNCLKLSNDTFTNLDFCRFYGVMRRDSSDPAAWSAAALVVL